MVYIYDYTNLYFSCTPIYMYINYNPHALCILTI